MKRVTRETWKTIAGYDGYYDVSNLGNVRTYHNGRWGKTPYPRPLPLKLSTQGYLLACLSLNGSVFRATVSRLVLEAFVGPAPADKPYACHGDRNPTNNALRNLRWGSNSDNQNDRVVHGTSNRGEANGMATVGEAEVRLIKRRLAAGEKQSVIATDFNLSQPAISLISTGRNWSHVTV